MKLKRLFAVALIAMTVVPIGALAVPANWPQWRGPHRDGHSPDTGLLKEWPADGPKLLWKSKEVGTGYTNVSVVDEQLFAMGDIDGASCVIALNCADGKPLWHTKVGKGGAPGWGGFSGPRCTPTIDEGLVYAISQYGDVLCADAATGASKWHKNYHDDFDGQLPEWGYCGMPLVAGDRVILGPGGSKGDLVAVNKKTGESIWQSTELTDGIHYSSPILAEIGGVRQIIQLTDAHVAGIDPETGKLLWKAERKGATAVIPTPVCHDGKVYVSSGYGAGCNLFEVNFADGKFSAKESYANQNMQNHHGGVVLVGENLYGFSDSKGWTCQNFESGKAVWQSHKLGKGSLVFADGMLYLRKEGDKGTIALIDATPEGYREKGRFDQPDRSSKNSWPHPVVIGGRLYIRDQEVL